MIQLNNDQRKLVLENYNLIYGVMKTLPYQIDHKDDIEQSGAIALCLAATRYDESSGAEFSTFATSYIKGTMLTYLNDKVSVIRRSRKSEVKEKYPFTVVSLEDPTYSSADDGEISTIGETILDPTDYYEEVNNDCLVSINKFIDKSKISPRNKELLKTYYFRVYHGENSSCTILGEEFGVTRARAHSLIQTMNRRIRENLKIFDCQN